MLTLVLALTFVAAVASAIALSTGRLPRDGKQPTSSNIVNHIEQFIAAMDKCEALARTRVHSLGRWAPA